MDKEQLLDSLANHSVWRDFPRPRLISLVESGETLRVDAGETLFEQYHPAKRFFLLGEGRLNHLGITAKRDAHLPFGPISWPLAAIGWSGFLQPQRYGTTVTAEADSFLVAWPQERLNRLFYADPELSVRFFRLILHSVCRQFRDLREKRSAGKAETNSLLTEPTDAMEHHSPIAAAEALRRSAFFGRFADQPLNHLADAASSQFFAAGSKLVNQDQPLDGLILLASGSCHIVFEKLTPTDSIQQHRFSRFGDSIGIVSGIPTLDGNYTAEASVYAESDCWVYTLSASSIESYLRQDPEFGRTYLQRLLARLAGLIGAIRILPHQDASDPEVETIVNLIANNQTQLLVTSQIHQIPHLLRDKLTVGTAITKLESIAAKAQASERQIAAQAYELTRGFAREQRFYTQVLKTVDLVIQADESLDGDATRQLCDESLDQAFDHLDCRVLNQDALPKESGCIYILNHLGCPAYYELPNGYHFSFDTAFVGWMLWKHYGASALRVVRASPDAEFGHNLFYRRLEHITVPTV